MFSSRMFKSDRFYTFVNKYQLLYKMSYQSSSISNKSTIKINNPKVAVKGSLTSTKEKDEQEKLVNPGIPKQYKDNLVLVFVIVVTVSIVITGIVLFTTYN